MPTVTNFITEALEKAPNSFSEKATALEFLQEKAPLDRRKRELALKLLREVAEACECGETWKVLVEERLVAAEQAMRFVLPSHRDHVLHSAHLYLLGVALYLKMLRPDPALAAVIADTYYRDARAFFGAPDIPYSCQPGILNAQDDLDTARKKFPNEFRVSPDELALLNERCPICSPSDVASDANFCLQLGFDKHPCCEPRPVLLEAFNGLTKAVRLLDGGSRDLTAHIPCTLEDVDAVFRRRWGLTAILHDAAYPIELAAKQIDDYVDKVVKPLGCTFSPCPKPFGLTLNRLCDFVNVPLIQSVCSDRFNNLMYGDNSVMLLATNLSHKLHVEYSPQTLAQMMAVWLESGLAANQVDHGLFSALLMLRQINHELTARLGDKSTSRELVFDNASRRISQHYSASTVEFFYIECVDAAAAIYLHTAKVFVDLFKDEKRPLDYRNHPFAWLLFLCDQLQEWLRPSGAEYELSEELFAHAEKYELVVDSGAKLFFSYPGDSGKIGIRLQKQLRLFGQDFVRHAH